MNVILKREKYLILFSLCVFLAFLGTAFNVTAIKYNNGKMPIYEKNEALVSMDDIHFTFSNKSEVNYFILTDIFSTPFFGEGYFSLGDILYFFGSIGSLIFGVSWGIILHRDIKKWKQT